jgi:hypothetical protein
MQQSNVPRVYPSEALSFGDSAGQGSEASHIRRRDVNPQGRSWQQAQAPQSTSGLSHYARQLDIFPKTEDDNATTTSLGGLISFVTFFVALWLLVSEYASYRTVHRTDKMGVDTTMRTDFFIDFDVTWPGMPCVMLTNPTHTDLIAERKESGEQPNDFFEYTENHIMYTQIDENGEEDDMPWILPKTFEEWKERNVEEEVFKVGCRVSGTARGSNTKGSLGFPMGEGMLERAVNIIYQGEVRVATTSGFDNRHIINHVSFGPDFDGRADVLDGVSHTDDADQNARVEFNLQIVPTTFIPLSGDPVKSYQYAVATEVSKVMPIRTAMDVMRKMNGDPKLVGGLFWKYTFSPYAITIEEKTNDFISFLVSMCAILGGVFAVAGLFDAFMFHVLKFKDSKRRS